MRPLISFYGGKQRMSSKIVPLIPKHTVYVEPFCGGAAVFFAKPCPDIKTCDHYREVINDIAGDVVNLYRCFQDKEKAEILITRLQATPYSREEWELSKDRNETLNDIERAARYYIKIQTSFASVLHGGWGTSIFGRNAPVTFKNKNIRLDQYLNRMLSVYIEHDDALNVIKRWDSPQTFFYCDPPYVGANQGHYKGYSQEDLERLIATLNNAHGSFILSGYDNQAIPKDWQRFEFKAYCSASPKYKTDNNRDKTKASVNAERCRVEVVWKRNATIPVRSEIQKLYDSGKFDCFTG
jgi:DNA adenine methylase